MKKQITTLLVALVALVSSVQAEEVKFGYDLGADIVSSWLWRGCYNGGLSFQPMADIGWDSNHTSFRAGVWANLGASNWKFNGFIPETDFFAGLNIYGATLGFTYYGYYDGSKLLSPKEGSQIEVSAGLDLETELGIPFKFTCFVIPEKCEAYSSKVDVYLEAQYRLDFKEGMSLTSSLGFGIGDGSSMYSHNDSKWTIIPTLRFDKGWELKHCNMGLYCLGTLNGKDLTIKHDTYQDYMVNGTMWHGLGLVLGWNVWF